MRKQPELVSYAVADGRIVERCERILKARRKSSKTAVAQAHIDFFGDYVVGVYAQFGERLFGRFEQMCVDKHVFGQAADEIFQ